MMPVHWDHLKEQAIQVAANAYAPYSELGVGAAAQIVDATGQVVATVTGTNVENASYGLTMCAETSMIAAAVSQGHLGGGTGTTLKAVVVVDHTGELLAPCGRCRQVLAEFADATTELLTTTGVLHMADLLPLAFGPADLPEQERK